MLLQTLSFLYQRCTSKALTFCRYAAIGQKLKRVCAQDSGGSEAKTAKTWLFNDLQQGRDKSIACSWIQSFDNPKSNEGSDRHAFHQVGTEACPWTPLSKHRWLLIHLWATKSPKRESPILLNCALGSWFTQQLSSPQHAQARIRGRCGGCILVAAVIIWSLHINGLFAPCPYLNRYLRWTCGCIVL